MKERGLARKKGRSHNQPAKGDVIPGQVHVDDQQLVEGMILRRPVMTLSAARLRRDLGPHRLALQGADRAAAHAALVQPAVDGHLGQLVERRLLLPLVVPGPIGPGEGLAAAHPGRARIGVVLLLILDLPPSERSKS